jgi:hypothetical protein
MKEGPVSDPDSYFADVEPLKTHAVMEALRQHKIEFSASINPTPGEGEAESDVFDSGAPLTSKVPSRLFMRHSRDPWPNHAACPDNHLSGCQRLEQAGSLRKVC